MAKLVYPTSTQEVPETSHNEEIPHVLPLENGDRLTRYEFERRYLSMPEVKKAELIERVVYMQSPVRNSHGQSHSQLITWLGTYSALTPGTLVSDNATVRLDVDNEPQPDALLRLTPEVGGTSHITDDDYIEGPPELIVEIAGSSAAIDVHDKKQIYRRNGVQEYLVWRVYDRQIDWWELYECDYRPLSVDQQGMVQSCVFPGLCLVVAELLQGNIAAVLATLQKGMQTPEHMAFVKRLTGAKED
ncbi:MAG: Uma2 family endonuclease [Chloroflexi bacterium AL-W]|nr:Uma2 family endonuclease [Chloroflexi bacterium AL-N1]NOK68967.1 Uma2 family endonuclease [Chloroflexi bacterium AL-N10]NOK76950.1 Uma2 family endonuclease [Chloroflexi bacterium AL-N5]NOK82662.1 Uma2 family endonuclease [Chloroflexi bacterium AL-W]NOK90807.1 Uma2 family endonuclease [Chloroflexi bacterium AL-N15]